MKQRTHANWHELPESEVVRLLESDPIRTGAARRRQDRHVLRRQLRTWPIGEALLRQRANPAQGGAQIQMPAAACRRKTLAQKCTTQNHPYRQQLQDTSLATLLTDVI